MAIGAALWDDDGDNNRGHARIYAYDPAGDAWEPRPDIVGEDAGDHAGAGVALNFDGSVVAVGAQEHVNAGGSTRAGQARIFDWTGAAWEQRGDDIDGESHADLAGTALSLSSDGTVVAVGARFNDASGSVSCCDAGHVRVFRWDGSAWRQRGVDVDGEAKQDSFGVSVSLSADGEYLAVGANGNDGAFDGAGHARAFAAGRAPAAPATPAPTASPGRCDAATLLERAETMSPAELCASCCGDCDFEASWASDFSARSKCICLASAIPAPGLGLQSVITLSDHADCLYLTGDESVMVLAGDGDDLVALSAHTPSYESVVYGEDGDDELAVYASEDVLLVGGAGDDTIRATGDSHTLCATTWTAGVCEASVEDACEVNRLHLIGDDGALWGSPGNDVLTVNGDSNVATGDAGDDVLCALGGSGNTLEEGDANGSDECYYDDGDVAHRRCARIVSPLACDEMPAAPATCSSEAGGFVEGGSGFVEGGDEETPGETPGGDEAPRGPSCASKKGRDSKSWHRKDAPMKTCAWVERKPTKRCRKKGATGARALTECVRACASCPSEGACADDASWSHTNKKNKKLDCVSVARNAGRRCALPGAAAACERTCGEC